MTETAVLTKLCDTADVSEDLPVRAEIEGFGYAIFQAGDQYYVAADLSSHGPGYLSDGLLADRRAAVVSPSKDLHTAHASEIIPCGCI